MTKGHEHTVGTDMATKDRQRSAPMKRIEIVVSERRILCL